VLMIPVPEKFNTFNTFNTFAIFNLNGKLGQGSVPPLPARRAGYPRSGWRVRG
jgi:hypothetical protein